MPACPLELTTGCDCHRLGHVVREVGVGFVFESKLEGTAVDLVVGKPGTARLDRPPVIAGLDVLDGRHHPGLGDGAGPGESCRVVRNRRVRGLSIEK